ncbi:MAG: DUF6543 domain-containing protein [Luteibacter sp.]|uniref:dermonecrotic toxin domain-containing protein n=2 Tax=Luteibacter sp. TaxID=1886636 RepID=UPI002807F668|nr:DUF6543 domain-containing protein [Luteibacter sp.]MDQ7994366.1 hypothetical protein [Luteibacter sp.]
MDMTPPQAPPAIVSDASQASIDTVARLDATQAWLIAQQDSLPVLPDAPDVDGKAAFLGALHAHWQAPVDGAPGMAPGTRVSALAQRMADVARDDGALLRDDGTLDAAAADLAMTASRAGGAPLPASVTMSELLVGGSAYAGAFVVKDGSRPDLVLAFTPDRGWERFDGVETLRQVLDHRLRQALASGHGLVAVDDASPLVLGEGVAVSERPLGEQPFARLAERIVATQAGKIGSAWDRFAAGDCDVAGLVDHVTAALRLSSYVDVHAALDQRDIRLAEAIDEARLRDVPVAVRDDWYRARADYRNTMQGMGEARRGEGMTEALSLDAFVRAQLAARLIPLGITDDPSTLAVTMADMPTGDPIATLSMLFGGTQGRKVPLVALALRNIASHGLSVGAVSRDDGQPLSVPLNGAALATMIRELDAGRRYAEYLESRLRSTPAGATSRDFAIALQQARMRFEAADARIAYYRRDEPRSFYDDQGEFGYRLLAAALDAPTPGRRAKVLGHDVVVHQLTFKGVPLSDMVFVAPRDSRASSRVVFYTPDAPDGRTYREFASRAEAAREFLLNPTFESYLLDRLPAEFAQTEQNGSRRFRMSDGSRLANWVLSQQGNAGQSRTDSPFEEREVRDDFLKAMYDASVDHMLHDVRAGSRTTGEADAEGRQAVLASLMSVIAWQERAVAHTVSSVVQSVPRTFQASWRFYDNVRAGDYSQAYLDMVDGYTSALNVIGLRPVLPRVAGAMVRARASSTLLTPTRRSIPRADAVFESRFEAAVDLAGATRSSEGFHVTGGRHYLRQHDKVYGVRYDREHATWRLTRAGAPDANFTGPAIARSPDGVWTYRRDVGLLGGAPHAVTPEMHVLLRDRGLTDPEVGGLNLAQRDILLRELSRLAGGSDEAVQVLRGTGTAAVPAGAHASTWREALRLARHLPGAPINRSLVASSRLVHDLSVGTAPANMVVVPPSEWPATVWYYLPRDQADLFRGAAVSIRQHRLFTHTGIPVYSHSPHTAFPGIAGATYGSLKGAWLRIDLRTIATRQTGSLLPPFDLLRYGIGDPGTLTIRPRLPTGAPRAAPPNVWLWGNEFELGTWPRLPR